MRAVVGSPPVPFQQAGQPENHRTIPGNCSSRNLLWIPCDTNKSIEPVESPVPGIFCGLGLVSIRAGVTVKCMAGLLVTHDFRRMHPLVHGASQFFHMIRGDAVILIAIETEPWTLDRWRQLDKRWQTESAFPSTPSVERDRGAELSNGARIERQRATGTETDDGDVVTVEVQPFEVIEYRNEICTDLVYVQRVEEFYRPWRLVIGNTG